MIHEARTAPVLSALEERADAFGRELAAALMLAGERAGRDRGLMREMTGIAAGEMRRAIEHLRAKALPSAMIDDFERACRNGFQAELRSALAQWQGGHMVAAAA